MDELLTELVKEGFTVIGYADDLVVVCRGKFLSALCDSTQRALRIIEKWCKKVGLTVNPNKTELIVFSQKEEAI